MTAMENLPNSSVPWPHNGAKLDFLYYGNHSGTKLISPLVEKCLVNDQVTPANMIKLAMAALSMYGENWTRKWAITQTQYALLENYDRREDTTITGTNTGTISRDTSTGVNTQTDVNNQQSIYGYDGPEGVPDNSAEGSTATSESSVGSETTTNSLANSSTTISRIHGNVGVTTPQQMMSQEKSFWDEFNFFDSVFADLDMLLTLSVYSI